MENQEAILAEYHTLRQELIQNIQMSLQVNLATLPIAAGVIAYGYQAQNAIAFLAAIVVLLSALSYRATSVRELVKIATYLYAIIEPKLGGLRWENMIEEKRKREFNLRVSAPITVIIYAIVGIGCIFFAWRYLHNFNSFEFIAYICVTCILANSFIAISILFIRNSSRRYFQDYASQWRKLEEILRSTVTSKPTQESEQTQTEKNVEIAISDKILPQDKRN